MDWWDNRDKELQRILKTLRELPETSQPERPVPVIETKPQQDQPLTRSVPAEPVRTPEAPRYRPAVLPLKPMTPEEFLEPGHAASIRRSIDTLIRSEAPISRGLLIKRVIQSCGITRAGSRIQNHLDGLLLRMALPTTTQDEGVFYWSPDQVPEDYLLFRVSGEGDSRRDIRDICVQEAANALYMVLHEQISMSREDLLRETAGKLGYTRLGTNVVALLEQSIEYARSRGCIATGSNGAIVLSPEGTARTKSMVENQTV